MQRRAAGEDRQDLRPRHAVRQERAVLPGGWRINPRAPDDPVAFGHRRRPTGMISADDMIIMGLQSATQWDSLAHVGYDGFFYNNVPASAVNNFVGRQQERLRQGRQGPDFAGRASRHRPVSRASTALEDSLRDHRGRSIAAEERQGVRVESGDILMLRTGLHKWLPRGQPGALHGPDGRSGHGHAAGGSTTARSRPGRRPLGRRGLPVPDPRRQHPLPPGRRSATWA